MKLTTSCVLKIKTQEHDLIVIVAFISLNFKEDSPCYLLAFIILLQECLKFATSSETGYVMLLFSVFFFIIIYENPYILCISSSLKGLDEHRSNTMLEWII